MDWKSVPLGDGEVAIDMGEEDWQGFGGLEECTQYTLMKPSELKKNEETGSKEKIHVLSKNILNDEKWRDIPKINNKHGKKEKKVKNPVKANTDVKSRMPLSDKKREKHNGLEWKSSTQGKQYLERKKVTGTHQTLRSASGAFLVSPIQENILATSANCDSHETFSMAALETRMATWKPLLIPVPVLRALDELGFNSPTLIQALTIPSAIRDHKDILGAAETGSGKTLAFAIPIIHGILQEKLNSEGLIDGDNKLEALILTPTRELALQVRNHIVAAAKYTDIKVGFVIGGLSQEKQERLLKKRPQIIVATPGRLWELMERVTSYLQNIESVRYLVIDEADRMVEKGHFQELHRILERLNASIARRQTFVFSATLTLVHAPPSRLKSMKAWTKTSDNKLANLMKTIKMNGKPKVVDLTRKLGTAEMLSEARILCGKEEKDMYLYYFLVKHPGRTLVFCNSIDCVRHLKGVFDQLQCQPLWLHASMLQKQRLKNLEKFSSKPQGLLLATDVAARGLDIPGIQHVLHYQVPRTSESYIHRSGRTARAAKEGLSVILMDPSEVSAYRKLCFTLNREADLPVFPIDAELMPSIQDRVKLAQQLALEMHRLEKKSADSKWFEKAAKELDLALSDSDFSRSSDSDDEDKKDEQQEKSKLVGQLRSRLNQLLSQPIAPRRQMGITKYPTRSGKLDLPSVQNEQTALEALQEEKQEPESLKFLRKVKSGKVKKQKQKKLKRRK